MNVEISSTCSSHWLPDSDLCKKWIQQALRICDSATEVEISLRFVDQQESNSLNLDYRGKDSATNVLSFPADIPAVMASLLPEQPLGDIVLCPEVVEREAELQSKDLQSHWAHLMVHGVLHLLGFDHEDSSDAATMESLEIEILESLGIANPYLVG